MDVYVERLYAALTAALRRSQARAFATPVTVAEIYQDLVPYRVVRGAIGFEMNADYEHALLQLLSGTDGLARMEPEEAAAELREELASPNPNVGLFRKFAACDVWIRDPGDEPAPAEPESEGFAPEPVDEADVDATPDRDAAAAASAADAHAKWRPAIVSDTRPAAEPEPDVLELNADEVVEEHQDEANGHAPATIAARMDRSRRCGFCDASLPAGRLIRFCPHCGGDQTRTPCVSCGESLDKEWRFCVACGAQQDE